MTNDDIVRESRKRHEDSIRVCSARTAKVIVSRLPKNLARRIDTTVLAEIIEREFQKEER